MISNCGTGKVLQAGCDSFWMHNEMLYCISEELVPEKCEWQLLVLHNLRKMVLGPVHEAAGMGRFGAGKMRKQRFVAEVLLAGLSEGYGAVCALL